MNRIAGLITQLYWVSARGWVTLSSFLLTCAGVGSPWCKPAQRYPEEPGATQPGTEGHRGTPRESVRSLDHLRPAKTFEPNPRYAPWQNDDAT